MIIFYDKQTGNVLGTIDGRIHSESQLKMWIGDKETTDRLIVQFEPVNERVEIVTEPRYQEVVDEDGFIQSVQTGVIKRKVSAFDFEPDCQDESQKKIFKDLDRKNRKISEFKVDTKTKSLVAK